MKKYFIAAMVVLFGIVAFEWYQLSEVYEKWETAEANVKAYSEELSSSKNKNT